MTLSPPFGMVADFDLASVRATVENMPSIEGEWPYPASLSRFKRTEMDQKMAKRFFKKIELFDMGHVPEPTSVWVQFNEPCWLWKGGLHPKGYGRFWLGWDPVTGAGIWSYSHRIAFEHFVTIPKPGYIVDHECNVKTCCNPVHLWPVSNIENLRLADERRPWKRRNQYSKE